jgi:hypothetical protein
MLLQRVSAAAADRFTTQLSDRRGGARAELHPARAAAAKRAFTTRRVDLALARQLATKCAPLAGDLVLARVESIGLHGRLESPEGRRCRLYVGDEIIVAYGARYAPDQFEAVLPDDLGPCDLAAGGGIAARVTQRHDNVSRPTRIAPIGLLGDGSGRILNLRRFAIEDPARPSHHPTVIAVAGTSMNSGKTTTAASLVQGLARSGLKVGAAKVTGTGSGGDLWSLVDAGARCVLDFTDLGHASTADLDPLEVERVALAIIDRLAHEAVDIAVLEVADGLLQRETAHLLSSGRFKSRLDGLIFAAGDAMGAAAGVNWLQERGLPMLAVSGLVTTSPLGVRETEAVTGLPVVGIPALVDPLFAPKFCLAVPAAAYAVCRADG